MRRWSLGSVRMTATSSPPTTTRSTRTDSGTVITRITVGDRPVKLTKKEFKLLQVLLEAKGRVLSRDALLEQAWPHSSIHGLDTRTVDVHVGRLRRKLGTAGRHIITVRNVGFRFDVLPEWITGHRGGAEAHPDRFPRRH